MNRTYVERLNQDSRTHKAQQLPRELWDRFRTIYESGANAIETGPMEMATYFEEADVIICMGLPYGSIKWAPRLKWVQAWSAGVDHMRGSGVLEAGVPVTTLAGANAISVAEHTIALMLMLARNMKGFIENAHNRIWRPTPDSDELTGKTVGIVGLGAIGGSVAKMCQGFDMRILGTRRSVTVREANVEHVNELLPSSELPYLLGESDFVVLSCPLSAETERLIGKGELRSMKSTSFLINVSRGEVVDEPALIEALREGWIAGAGLDVFWTEPLENQNPLWDLPSVIMTSHRAGRSIRNDSRAIKMFEDNLDRYLLGQPLVHMIDP